MLARSSRHLSLKVGSGYFGIVNMPLALEPSDERFYLCTESTVKRKEHAKPL